MNKESSKQVSIRQAIYECVDKIRIEEGSTLKMTPYIEELLNQWCKARLASFAKKRKS